MTFEEWLSTERVSDAGESSRVVESHFGYTPLGTVYVHQYSPGVLVGLDDGSYFTHIGLSEYSGTLQEVREILWREHASIEAQEGG